MPLTIREIKLDLIKWNILEDSYNSYEKSIKDTDKLFNCTIDDYLVQIWINMKIEVEKFKPRELLPLIPIEQVWFKKMLIKMLIGQPCLNLAPLANALASCSAVGADEAKYLHLMRPTRGKSH